MIRFPPTVSKPTDVVLCGPAALLRSGPFLGLQWKSRWSRIHRGGRDALAAKLTPIVRVHPNDRLPRIEGTRLSIWLTELAQLEEALEHAERWKAIVFEPSDIAVLDCIRAQRETLVARRSLAAGHVLQAKDLSKLTGGGGVAADRQARVVGKSLTYDVAEGEDITFGVID